MFVNPSSNPSGGKRPHTTVFRAISHNSNTTTVGITGRWQTWQKPQGAKLVYIFALGAGGGGSGGQVAVAGTNKVGAAGGNAGSYSMGLWSAWMLPDTLYLCVGSGGVGGSAVITQGAKGGDSIVCMHESATSSTSAFTAAIESAILIADGGLSNNATTVTNPPSATQRSSNTIYSHFGIVRTWSGLAAITSPSTVAANGAFDNYYIGTYRNFHGGGSAGGGTNVATPVNYSNGSTITANTSTLQYFNTVTPFNSNATNVAAGTQSQMPGGFFTMEPFFISTPAPGGAAAQAVSAAALIPAPAGPGCGGSGGGASTVLVNGGTGGDGLIIITAIF